VNYKGVEYTLRMFAPGIWDYRFQIGRAIKHGKTRAKSEPSAISRVHKRIARELKNAGIESAGIIGR
jgi:hypothetical protein